MKVMIFAAGKGTRLAPLTAKVPKPLLEIGGASLLERHLRQLCAAGFSEVVINVSHLGAVIEERIGDGRRYGLTVRFSREPAAPLETGGGLLHALPLLGDEPFVAINGDVWTDFPLAKLMPPPRLAHLVLVPNPAHNADGDFGLEGVNVTHTASKPYTFAGIAVYKPALLQDRTPGAFRLAPVLFERARAGQVTGEIHRGHWFDIGTPKRLDEARRGYQAKPA